MQLRISEYVQWEAFVEGVPDSHGNVTRGYAPPVPVGIYVFNPGTTGDTAMSGHDRDFQNPSIHVPTSVVMSARDRVTVRGWLYEVDGDTREFRNPYNHRMDSNQIGLRRTEG